jgi:hypothetical protein
VHRPFPFEIFKNEKGAATLMVAILAAIMLLLATAFLKIRRGSEMGGIDGLRFYSAVDIIKSNIYFFGQNVDAWNATLTYNKAAGRMACINTTTDCTVNASFSSDERVVLVQPGAVVYYDTTVNGKDGFRYNGSVCDYDSARIVSGCTIRADVRWRPFCSLNCTVGTNANAMVFHAFFSTPYTSGVDPAVPIEQRGYKFNSTRVNGIIVY